MGITVPPGARIHYKDSIRAAYTAGEPQSMLERSPLQELQIREEFLDITIERWPGDATSG
jgi:hypothetical protein